MKPMNAEVEIVVNNEIGQHGAWRQVTNTKSTYIFKLDESSFSPGMFRASASVSTVFTKFMLTTLKVIGFFSQPSHSENVTLQWKRVI